MYGDFFGKSGDTQYHIEYGANWVEGLTGNPIWEMAQAYILDGNLEDFSNILIYDENGHLNLTETNLEAGSNCGDAAAALAALQELSIFCLGLSQGEPFLNDTVKEFCLSTLGNNFQPSNTYDVSCQKGEIITTGFFPPNEPNPAVARLCQWYSLDLANLEPPTLLSVKDTLPDYNSIVFDGANYFVRDKRGYKWLIESTGATFLSTSVNSQSEIVFNDPRLNLNTKVVKVQWDPKGQSDVTVTLCETRKVVLANSPVLYPCVASKPYITVRANYFVSTFSVGVLKASLDMERTRPHIRDLTKTQDVAPVFQPPLSLIPDTRYFPGSNILFLTVVYQRAIEISLLSDDDIIAEVLPVLNLMFANEIQAANGGKLLTSSDVLDFHLYRWHSDPLFRGTYSTNIVNAALTALGDRYGNLVFSGEVTCRALNGYVHGAYLAGIRSARLLLSQRFGITGLNLSSVCDF